MATMIKESDIPALNEQVKNQNAEEVLRLALEWFGGRIALASSLQAEDQVLTDMLCGLTSGPSVFTLDTGRLHNLTYDTIDKTNRHYHIQIEMLFPDASAVEALVNEHGPNPFYQSIELRKCCCHIRKVAPLQRKLKTLGAWITGQRRDQALTRGELEKIEWDRQNQLVKFNPLADWTTEQVWDYIRQHEVPYNPLHDQGYPSIGCAPCTRPVKKGEDVRAGRWWWEEPQHKECGLHLISGQLVARKGVE